MRRRILRLCVAGGALTAVTFSGGVSWAASSVYPGPGASGPGGTTVSGTPDGSGVGLVSFSGGSVSGGTSLIKSSTSGGGAATGGGGTSSDVSTSSGGASMNYDDTSTGGMPFTGFELVGAVVLGGGLVGSGAVLVTAARRRRESTIIA
jgi:hypothetical protein